MDGHYKQSLAAVRALSVEGVEVHVGAPYRHALSFYSKYVQKRFLYPNPTKKNMFVGFLETIDRQENYDCASPHRKRHLVRCSDRCARVGEKKDPPAACRFIPDSL